jgi:hypothetical protein
MYIKSMSLFRTSILQCIKLLSGSISRYVITAFEAVKQSLLTRIRTAVLQLYSMVYNHANEEHYGIYEVIFMYDL